MKQLSALNIARLRTEESFGYQKQVVAETANLPIGGEEERPGGLSVMVATDSVLETKVNEFTTAVDAFDDALKASATNPATATATATDDARDASWRGSNNYLTAMCAHPDAEIAAYAAETKSLFDKYGDPTKLAQTEESGVLHNLLQDLEALDSSKRTALNLDVWITDLKTKENAFLAAAESRCMDYGFKNERKRFPCCCSPAHRSRCSPSGGHRKRNPYCCRNRLPLAGGYGKRTGDDKRRCGICYVYRSCERDD